MRIEKTPVIRGTESGTSRAANHSLIPGNCTPWRGSLLPLGCAAAPIQATRSFSDTAFTGGTTAAQPSGSKLPRHGI
nr:hypothetical protein C1892_12110 [Pseudomonas sp. MPBD7-1]